MTDETKPRPWECLRFGKEIVVSNAAEVKHRKSLLRLISARLGAERRKLRRTEGVENRNRVTCEIKRLQELRTQLRQAPAVAGADHPKVRAAIHRAIKTKRAWIKRHLQPDNVLARNERKALESQLKDLDDLETVLFGVQRRRVARSFP